jgi:hypothetical protein
MSGRQPSLLLSAKKGSPAPVGIFFNLLTARISMNNHDDFAGWFYRKDGNIFGPISTHKLRGLLRSGQLLPRQPVWQRESRGALFIHAETAARHRQEETIYANQRSHDARCCFD